MRLAGWGRFPVRDCREATPRTLDDLRRLLGEGPLIARGAGRAYGDSALNESCTVSMRRFDRMLAFDEKKGVLACEAGVMLADVLDVLVPRGFFPSVTPGTRFVTVGGMVAADVHGKNHHVAGSFGAHLRWIDVMTGEAEVVRCAPEEEAELYRHTVGGMGLTGIVLRAAFELVPVETAYLVQETVPAADLDEALAAFEASGRWTYSVAWIDCQAGGGQLGRSLLYRAEHAKLDDLPPRLRDRPLRPPARGTVTVPLDLPSWALNRWSLRAFNERYYAKGRRAAGRRVVDYETFFYPLDAIGGWNRLYGRRGLAQYQCVLPRAGSRDGLAAMLETVGRAGQGSPLAVLKLFGPGDGVLSFPAEGYTLALDFPVRPATLALMDRLDAIVAAHGGHLYLAKDARMPESVFRKTQPNLEDFAAFRREAGADRHFASVQSRRLGL